MPASPSAIRMPPLDRVRFAIVCEPVDRSRRRLTVGVTFGIWATGASPLSSSPPRSPALSQ